MTMMVVERPDDLTSLQRRWLDAADAADPGSPLLAWLRVARRWWLTLSVVVLAGALLGLGSARVVAPRYLAETYVLVDAETLRAVLTLDDLFRTQPVTLLRAASRRNHCRYPTPCTRPAMVRWRVRRAMGGPLPARAIPLLPSL